MWIYQLPDFRVESLEAIVRVQLFSVIILESFALKLTHNSYFFAASTLILALHM